jgi:hypothetical protein
MGRGLATPSPLPDPSQREREIQVDKMEKNVSEPPSTNDESTRENDDDATTSYSLMEGKDYYLEGTLMVFTERFLTRRGFCCESSCRHCPYGFSKNSC